MVIVIYVSEGILQGSRSCPKDTAGGALVRGDTLPGLELQPLLRPFQPFLDLGLALLA